MSGSHGWLQSMEGSEYLIDIRAQWSEEKLVIEELLAAELAPMSALRTTKIGKVSGERASQPPLEVLGMDAQADSQPEHELEGHDRDIACGFCTCRLLPIGRLKSGSLLHLLTACSVMQHTIVYQSRSDR